MLVLWSGFNSTVYRTPPAENHSDRSEVPFERGSIAALLSCSYRIPDALKALNHAIPKLI